jgi:uncharacterized protein YegP (UPF0339 family)
MATGFDMYKDQKGEFRWRLVAENGKVVADSGEGYQSKEHCKDGIGSVKRLAPTATIHDNS